MKAITKILLLAAVMAVFIMLPVKVQAATHDVSTLEDLKTVVASVYSGDTVNITGDITLDSDLTITNPNAFTITSSGSTIACGSYKIVIGAGADVTAGGDLAITGAASSTISVQSGGRFTLAGGTVSNSASYAVESSGNAVISGGTVNAEGSSGVGVRALSGGVTISGGVINATGVSGIGVQAVNSAWVTISGGTVSASGTGVRVANSASVTINSGAVSASGAGVLLAGSTSSASATINGGTVSATGGAGTGVQVTLGTLHINGGDISGAGKGVNLASGQVNITVSGGLLLSGGVYDSSGPSFLSALPSPATVTAGQTGQVALEGVDGSITFAIDPATAGELAASIASNTVTLQPAPGTQAGGYDLVLTAQSGSGNLKLTVPVTVEGLPDISGDFTDPNFRQAVWEWLGNSGAPGSFTKQDLTDRMPAQGYALYVSSKNIASLAGLEHFQGTGIRQLVCASNQLTSLPALPDSLITLVCYENQLASLPDLPGGLQTLNCNNNQLTGLPALPASLQALRCESNRLTALPALGANVSVVECGYNQLTSLPQLPSGLTVLKCYYNQLEALPELPSNLQWLMCSGNRLSSLPGLPNTLTALQCGNNRLTTLPDLPPSLQNLNCSGNFINVFSGTEKDKLDACPAGTKTVTPQYRYAYTGTGLAFTSAGETREIQAADVIKEWSDDGNTWTDTYEQTDFGLFAFASSDANVATVDSQGVVTAAGNGSCVIYARFAGIASAYTQAEIPVTVNLPATVINIAAIEGVTPPARGAAPVTAITETAQYTGTVSWTPADNPFRGGTVYTATITLTPKAGYTLTGVAENFFTVAGATSVSNAAGWGVVTAVFPATEADPPANNPPVAKNPVPTQSVTAGSTAAFTASDIAEDADNDTLTITAIVTPPASGTATASLDSGTVTLTGVAAGDTSVVVTVYDGTDTADITVPVSVTAAPVPPSITTASLPDGTVDTAYSQTLTASGDAPITWSLDSGSLPTGLTLSNDGGISGTPTAAGTFNFTVKAENSAGSDTKALSITINPAPAAPTITTQPTNQTVTAGETATFTVAATGDAPLSYRWKKGRS